MNEPDYSGSADDIVVEKRSKPQSIQRPDDANEVKNAAVPADSENGGAAALLAVARTQPFMRNFIRCAHDRFPKRANAETRVSKMIEEHPRWYKFCWWADWLLVAAAVTLLIAGAGLLLWKTFLT